MSVKRFVWPAFELLVVGLVFCCSCTRTSEQDRSKARFSDGAKKKYEVESDEKPFPAGPLMQDYIAFQFAIYYLPSPKGDPLDCLNELLQTEFKDLRWVHRIVRKGDSLDSLKELFQPQFNGQRRVNSTSPGKEGILVEAKVINYVQTSYTPPNLDLIQRFGHGLSQEQATALQDSQTAMLLDFGYPKEHVWDGMRTALSLASRIARKTGGLLWDAETREVYTPDAWEMERIEGWTEDVPDLARHTVILARNNGEDSRMCTEGMTKFGLPDVVVDLVPESLHRNMGSLIELFAQAMAEGGASKLGGEFDLDIRTIRNLSFREFQIMSLKANAASVALLSLREGTRQEFDPNSRIIEITFARYPGHDLHAQQQEMLGSLFGWEDLVKPVMESQELKNASKRARAKLPSLRAAFNSGIAPGESIRVKAPFETPDGEGELMWVEVTSWKGDRIRGILRNEPFSIPTLHIGQEVEVSEATVFDYLRRHADGSEEGNETEKFMDRRLRNPHESKQPP